MSAGNTARSTLAAVRGDRVRALQHVLYRAAKADPGRRFHALRDKVYREDVLWRAWIAVRRNNGAPGIDKTTLADVEEYGVTRLLGELAGELRAGTWRPLPARKVLIPKPGSTERRPLAIAAVRDRIVQAAVKIVLEPVFEADFLPCSFGFRPGRSAHDALQVLIDEAWQGRRWVVETDIANCFSAIPQDKLMRAVEERISDQAVLKLLRAMLRAGVMQGGQVRREVTGAPQGGPASPLLCNIYLHRLDRVWDAGQHGVLVRYCDDLVVMCSTRQQAEAALARLTAVLGGLGLELKQSKTRIVHLTEDKDAEGFDFLGFHHRWVRARGTVKPSRVCFLARWPSRKAAQHARDRIRQITGRTRLLDGRRMDRGGTQPVPARLGRVLPVRELRPDIRCDQPVRPGTAGRVRGQAPQTQPYLGHAPGDLRVTGQLRADHLVRNRHRPQAVPALAGTGRTPTVKNVGEPCAGEPHARFDGEGLETEPRSPRQSLTLPLISL